MPRDAITTDEIVSYLLGTLDEADRSEIEDRIVGDDVLFERVEAAEGELLDAYARGKLSPDDRAGLERGVLATPEGRTRLAFARSLFERVATGRSVVPETQAEISLWARVSEWMGANRTLTFAAAAAAVLAVFALVSWISLQRNGPIAQPEQAQREPGVAPNSGDGEPSRMPSENLPPEVATVDEPRSEEPAPSRRSGKSGSVVAFVFAPVTTRGVEELRVLRVPAGASTIRLRLDLAAIEPGPLSAVLKTAKGRVVVSRTGLAPKRMPNGSRVTIDLPADALDNEEYNLALVVPGSDEIVADYLFRVVRE